MIFYFVLSFTKKLSDYIVIFNLPEDESSYANAYSMALSAAQSHMGADDKIERRFFNGFVANLSNETKNKLKEDSNIKLVEKDQEINVAEYYKTDIIYDRYYVKAGKTDSFLNVQSEAPWGISRISHGKYFNDDGTYIYPANSGNGVNVYVIDTGIEIDHPEFGGSAVWGANFVTGSPDTDEMGHGTHVAGTIAGKNSGIAKKANLIAVKVLDKYGMGKISRVIFGIDYVIKEHFKKIDELYDNSKNKFTPNVTEEVEFTVKGTELNKNNFLNKLQDFLALEEIKPKTVVNMSVGGMKSQALEFAVDYATSKGIHFSVAAGNNHQDACYFSPGASRHAVTVSASTRDDTVAFFSNVGKCVDLFAPGHEIRSSWINKKLNTISGTSMAAPHVTGVMCLYLGLKNLTPDKLKAKLIEDSLNVIEDETDEEDMLDFWPINYLFGKENQILPLASIKRLNEGIKRHKSFTSAF